MRNTVRVRALGGNAAVNYLQVCVACEQRQGEDSTDMDIEVAGHSLEVIV